MVTPIVAANTPGTLVGFMDFDATVEAPGGTEVTFQLSVDGGITWRYWDGLTWAVATHLEEANEAAQITAQIGSLQPTSEGLLVRTILASNASELTPQVQEIAVDLIWVSP